jgi:hypothetical protein
MVIDFIIAVFAGIAGKSLALFLILVVLSALFARPPRPWSSGLLNLVLLLTGISILSSLFGGDCDCDL